MHKPLVIISGASSGIGAATAKIFSKAGYHLCLLARNIKAMQALQIPHSICIETDVTNHVAFADAIAKAEKQFGPVDCLINNAGFAKGGEFTELKHEDHQKTVEVNLLGVINGIEVVLPGMRERQSGTIINVSSIADRKSCPKISTYAATKAAVRSLTESLRFANAKYGVRICNVAPAKIKTPMLIQANLAENETIEVDTMANTLLWIYQQPQAVCIRDLVIAPTYYEA